MLKSRVHLCLLLAFPAFFVAAVGLERSGGGAKASPATMSTTVIPWIQRAVSPDLAAQATPTDAATATPTEAATATSTAEAAAAPVATAPANGSDRAAPADAATATRTDLAWLDEWKQGAQSPPRSVVIPVLMYHHVAPIDYSKANALDASLTVVPGEFEKQLDYMRGRGYTSISLREVWNYFQGGKELPPRAVVLTFDDGYNDVYSYALPLLVRYGFRGTFFIITGLVGQPRYMAMDQVLGLFRSGMEIGAHSSSHPSLTGLSTSRLAQELVPPKKHLEEVTGAPVLALAYPNGAYNQTVVAAARDAGYRVAVTTKYGALQQRDKLMELVRVRIRGAQSLTNFRSELERYYPAQR